MTERRGARPVPVMREFVAVEMDAVLYKLTGVERPFLALSHAEAMAKALAEARLSDGSACVSSAGRCLYPHGTDGPTVMFIREVS